MVAWRIAPAKTVLRPKIDACLVTARVVRLLWEPMFVSHRIRLVGCGVPCLHSPEEIVPIFAPPSCRIDPLSSCPYTHPLFTDSWTSLPITCTTRSQHRIGHDSVGLGWVWLCWIGCCRIIVFPLVCGSGRVESSVIGRMLNCSVHGFR